MLVPFSVNWGFYSVTHFPCSSLCKITFRNDLIPQYHSIWRVVFTLAMRKFFVFPLKCRDKKVFKYKLVFYLMAKSVLVELC